MLQPEGRTPNSYRPPGRPQRRPNSRVALHIRRARTSSFPETGTFPNVTDPPAPPDVAEAMAAALDEARAAGEVGEVPVGAVVLVGGEIVARAGNARERSGDPTAHAEILALRAAAAARGTWRLDDATLVVTLEPCTMCAGAMLAARIRRVVFGAANTDNGACGTLYNLCADPRLNHEIEVVHGVEADAAGELVRAFFADRRA